jgi:hypothetical protein
MKGFVAIHQLDPKDAAAIIAIRTLARITKACTGRWMRARREPFVFAQRN